MLNVPKITVMQPFSSTSSSSVDTVRIETKTYCFLLLPLCWNNFWKATALAVEH